MPTIIENRRNLHQIPEIELTTQKTAQYIENVLDLYDCTIDHPIPNSVTAFFDNKKEKTIVFRSDMDALPMEENTDLEFKSTNGCMHACGHDGHMAMVLEIAKYYTDCFKSDCDRLNIKWPETVVPATSLIDDYIKFIEVLMEKGYAYFTNGNVYFDTSKLKEYYQLTNHNEEELMHGVRESVEEDTNKRNKTDFVLWFTKSKFDSQELKWQSPWGMGYPGWHIECSCISLKYLGEQLDIHCGGVDNIFPHHTNEIAQTESYIGKKWCNYWFHVEHLNDKSGKMSKSNGEFLTVDLLIKKGFNPLAYRLFCLQSHYQKQLLFTYESLEGAQNTYDKLISKIKSINEDSSEVDKALFEKYNNMFKETLCDNLNTSNSLTVLYDVLKSDLNNNTKLALIKSFDKVLSLDLIKEEKYDEELISYIEDMIIKRSNAKKEGNYELADSIRNELLERGIILKDTREGTVYEVK